MVRLVPLNSIFHIKYGNQLDRNKMISDASGINFICRSSKNLGFDSKVKRIENVQPFEKGLITVTLGGTYLLSSFVQPEPFYTAQNIKVLKPMIKMSFEEKVFYCIAISKNRFRYTSHGREANATLDNILVPNIASVPDWVKDIKPLKIDSQPLNSKSLIKLDTQEWKSYFLKELFRFENPKTKTLVRDLKHQKENEGYPYLSACGSENGVKGVHNIFTESVGKGGILVIEKAVSGYCSYHSIPFACSGDIIKLLPKFCMNQYIALFLVTIINKERYRYNYGRKCGLKRLNKVKISLPMLKNGSPDFKFMEEYIQSLPHSSNLKC